MRTRNRFCQFVMIAFLLMGGTQSVSAQGFLDKLGKAIEKGGKALEKVNKGLDDVLNIMGVPQDSAQVEEGQTQAKSQSQTSKRTSNSKQGKSSIFQRSGAGQGVNGAAILETDANSAEIFLSGIAIEATVTVQLPSTDSKEYACLALMSNYKWNVKSLDDILTLGNELCYGEQMINSTRSQQKVTVSIPLEKSGFKGDEKDIYVQAYLVDVKNKKNLAQGEFVKVDEEKIRQSLQNSLPSNKDMENAIIMGVVGNMFGSVFGNGGSESSSSNDSGNETCHWCNGNGKCSICNGRKVDVNGDECLSCKGSGRCTLCNGTGKVVKSIF